MQSMRRLLVLLICCGLGCSAQQNFPHQDIAADTMKADVAVCEPGHEAAMSSGMLRIHPGETICVTLRRDSSSVTPLAVVLTRTEDPPTLVLKCWQQPGTDSV